MEIEQSSDEAHVVKGYSPLRTCGKAIHQLGELLPAFEGMDSDLKELLAALRNGKIVWNPPAPSGD
jgi:hypothetical protein